MDCLNSDQVESTVVVDHHSNYNETLHHTEFVKDSGMIFTAGQGHRLGIY